MTYKVQLPVFEGPLDLLLYLIKKEEINIYDIPIAKITDQYLEYMEVMKLLDLDIAGEFILMAATLMHIKSKMLLPVEDTEEEIAEETDLREELVKKLLEYKKFKEAASELKDMHAKRRDSFVRAGREEMLEGESDDSYFEASLFDLITAFSKVLKEIPKEMFHQVVGDEFAVSDKIHDLLHVLVDKTEIRLNDLFRKAKNKSEIITIFLALLELVKVREVILRQASPLGEIKVIRNIQWQKK